MAPFGFATGSAPRKPVLLVAESEESIQDTYDAEKWPLAQGALSEVTLRSTGSLRTVRTVAKLRDTDAEALKREVDVMKSLSHPNILELLEVFEDAKSVYLVTEHCTGGTVLRRLTSEHRFEEMQASPLMQQLFRAVRHMHERKLCHRGLQMQGLILATSGELGANTALKVSGFNYACEYDPDQPLREACGPVGYMAPEVIDKEYSNPCDLWSCGVIMFYMLCGYLPFTGSSDKEVMRESHRGAFFFHPKSWGNVSDCAKDLIRALLKRRPVQRYTAVQALHHEWFRGPKKHMDAAALKALGGDAKKIEEHPTDVSTSDLGSLDLELDADPAVEADVPGPLVVHSSARPVLLSETPA
uniref:Protein kinase domain-containing protein n=1 Tax=Alexandrium monilatum TaxID=311494 RepID=A0A7S4W394_9DINO